MMIKFFLAASISVVTQINVAQLKVKSFIEILFKIKKMYQSLPTFVASFLDSAKIYNLSLDLYLNGLIRNEK